VNRSVSHAYQTVMTNDPALNWTEIHISATSISLQFIISRCHSAQKQSRSASAAMNTKAQRRLQVVVAIQVLAEASSPPCPEEMETTGAYPWPTVALCHSAPVLQPAARQRRRPKPGWGPSPATLHILEFFSVTLMAGNQKMERHSGRERLSY